MMTEKLVEWCLKNGVQFGPITAGFVENGWRGVLALEDIERDTCILRVPRHLLLCCDSARRDEVLMAAVSGTRLTHVQLLAVHLLHEVSRGESSQWNVYLRSLPTSYTTAMCLKQEERDALQVPYAVQQADAAAHMAEQQWHTVLPVLRSLCLPPKLLSKSAWLWALSTLSSRTMFMPTDSAGALTPFGDLLNYAPPPPPYLPDLFCEVIPAPDSCCCDGESSDIENEDLICGDGSMDAAGDYYCIHTRRRYNKGDEIFMCYGRHTNLELLKHYGFVLVDENLDDVAELSPTLFPEEVQTQLKALGAVAKIHSRGNPSWELLRALRLASLSPQERRTKAANRALHDEKVTDASERWALKVLQDACLDALRQMPTTLRHDVEQLSSSFLSEGMHEVVEWRVRHKAMLAAAVTGTASLLSDLDSND